MNTLVLINALINKEETFKSFEEYFNDGNNYFVYSFEESLPDFQNFNFRNFKMANLIKIENIKIISDSKYLKINSKNFELGKFVFEKFFHQIVKTAGLKYRRSLESFDSEIFRLKSSKSFVSVLF